MSTDLIFRPLEGRDLPSLVEWANNPKLSCIPYVKTSGTLRGAKEWFRQISNSVKRKDFVLEENGRTCAIGGLTDISLKGKSKTASIYMFVYPSLLSFGFDTKIVESVCSYGFKELGLDKIYLCSNFYDITTRPTYEECGFKRGQEFMDAKTKKVEPCECTLSREDWLEHLKTGRHRPPPFRFQ